MGPFRLFTPTTLAVTTPPFFADQYDSITVSADALAGGETVQLQSLSGTTAKQVTDLSGTAINLTATLSAVALEGGPQYVFTKSVTAAPCAVYINAKDR